MKEVLDILLMISDLRDRELSADEDDEGNYPVWTVDEKVHRQVDTLLSDAIEKARWLV